MTSRGWNRFWNETHGYRPALFALLVLEILAVPLALAAPFPLAIAVDNAIGHKPIPGWLQIITPDIARSNAKAIAVTAALLVVVIALLNHLRGLASWLLGTWVGQQMLLQLRGRLFRQAQRMSLKYHDTRGSTDSTFRIQYDAAAIQQLATEGLNPVVTSVLTLLGMVWVAVLLDPVIAAIALSVIPPLVFVSRAYQRRLREGWSEVKGIESAAMAVLHETLGSLRVVKALSGERREQLRYERRARQTMRGHLRMALLEASMWIAVGMTMALCSAAVLYFAVRHVDSGQLSLGDMLIVIAYAAMISGPLETLARHIGNLQSSLASAERAFELLDQPEEVVEQPNARRVSRAAGKVEFERVTFHYEATGGGVNDLSFKVVPGTCVGLGGATGSGKTTLVSLLARFYDPESGRVLIDDVDIREYRLADLRNQFAIVLQEPVLFSTTVAENIAYASPEATFDDIQQAARDAEAHDFIMSLPDGYNTAIGERGYTLSGGQRQRLSIARTFLKDAPIVVLDEPTSSVDSETEERIMTAVRRLIKGRTTFLISHRPAVLNMCHYVVYLRDGFVDPAQFRSTREFR